MFVILGADSAGFSLKEHIKTHLLEQGYTVADMSEEPHADAVEAALAVGYAVRDDKQARGLVFDEFGAASYMACCKIKGIVACECSDERTAFMTREHNNARIVTLGAGIVGQVLATAIVDHFLASQYAAGRHQIRVDMLNRMA